MSFVCTGGSRQYLLSSHFVLSSLLRDTMETRQNGALTLKSSPNPTHALFTSQVTSWTSCRQMFGERRLYKKNTLRSFIRLRCRSSRPFSPFLLSLWRKCSVRMQSDGHGAVSIPVRCIWSMPRAISSHGRRMSSRWHLIWTC